MPFGNLEKSTQSTANQPYTNWKKKFEAREKAIRTLTEKNRGLENTIDLLSKKYQLIDKYLDTLAATHLQANWHKTKSYSMNRKALLEIDELFKCKSGFSWIEDHIKDCIKNRCMVYKEALK